jgi:hypothetical protein
MVFCSKIVLTFCDQETFFSKARQNVWFITYEIVFSRSFRLRKGVRVKIILKIVPLITPFLF